MTNKLLSKICIFLLITVIAGACVSTPERKDVALNLVGDPDNGGIWLPPGFEAIVVADSLGSVRHIDVNDNGDIYVKLRFPIPEGENVALRDTTGDGKADIIENFGHYGKEGRYGYGTGMHIYKGYLYVSTSGRVIRHKLIEGELVPRDSGELMLTDDYWNDEHGYSHIAKGLAFDNQGHMYVPFGAPSDCCQEQNRRPESPGEDPCSELEWHAGVWRFDADKPNQVQEDGYKFASGIRSIVGMDWNKNDSTLYAMQHGRDSFSKTWPSLYTDWQTAMLPSEEFLKVEEGVDAGWPYYYYDHMQGKKVLNPEYGGDGKKEGNGADYLQPLIGFPGHYAPNDVHFYYGDMFPKHYKNGAFIAFHGSTIRQPYPQAGYFVGFVPFDENNEVGQWEVFADGFAQVDTIFTTSDAVYRPMGVATGPDGSIYLSESEIGRIWRVFYTGEKDKFGEKEFAAMKERARTSMNIKDPHPVKDNLLPVQMNAGAKLYNRLCSACHMSDGKGDGARFPPLVNSEYVKDTQWELMKIILAGMEGTITVDGKDYTGVMPPMHYLKDSEIAQVITYVKSTFGEDSTIVDGRDVGRMRRRLERRGVIPDND